MNQLNCDIIKDLVPSYLDGICSDSSRKAVKEHLMQCPDCRSYLEALQSAEISSTAADSSELDYMKKVKKHYTQKNALGIVLLFILSQAVTWVLPQIDSYQKEIPLYCAIFSILAVGTFLLLTIYPSKPKMNKGRLTACILSALGIPYCIAIGVMLNHTIANDVGPFGIAMDKTGPFLNRQLVLIIIAELLLFGYYTLDAVRNTHMLGILPTVNLMCCTLCMSYRSLLFHMYIPNPTEIVWLGLVVLLLAVAVAAVELILTRLQTASKTSAFPES